MTTTQDGIGLDEAMSAYEEGVALAQFCLERLNAASLRVQELALEQ